MRLQLAKTAGATFFACSLHVEVSFILAKNEAPEQSFTPLLVFDCGIVAILSDHTNNRTYVYSNI